MKKASSLKAGVLSTVLFISILISVIIGSLLLLAYYTRLLLSHNEITSKLNQNADSGIAYQLSVKLPYNQPVELDLFNEKKDSVFLERKEWGVFDVILSKSHQGKHFQQKLALLGAKIPVSSQIALYLTDENRPLYIAGNTRITGNCFLPKGGVKTTYINNKGYSGDTLIRGKISVSNKTIPVKETELTSRILNYLQRKTLDNQLIKEKIPLFAEESFLNPTIVIRSYGDIVLLSDVNWKGNILIQATQRIIIDPSASLENIIVVAPEIVVKEGFKGTLQLIASDSVIVEKNCKLAYPSSICMYHIQSKSFLRMDENSKLEGLIWMKGENESHFYETIFKLSPQAQLTGEAVINGMAEIKGNITGSLYTRRLILQTPQTLYENHLLDVTLDAAKLSSFYLSSPLLFQNSPKSIIKWLK